jgi:transcriptional regulator with XRE-family HTH domain
MADFNVFYQEVGRRIRKARLDRRITQDQLGVSVSLTRTSITNIERGRQKLLLHKLSDIAQALRVAPATLLPENEADGDNDLDRALTGTPEPERDWIKTVVASAHKGSET